MGLKKLDPFGSRINNTAITVDEGGGVPTAPQQPGLRRQEGRATSTSSPTTSLSG